MSHLFPTNQHNQNYGYMNSYKDDEMCTTRWPECFKYGKLPLMCDSTNIFLRGTYICVLSFEIYGISIKSLKDNILTTIKD